MTNAEGSENLSRRLRLIPPTGVDTRMVTIVQHSGARSGEAVQNSRQQLNSYSFTRTVMPLLKIAKFVGWRTQGPPRQAPDRPLQDAQRIRKQRRDSRHDLMPNVVRAKASHRGAHGAAAHYSRRRAQGTLRVFPQYPMVMESR